MLLSTVSEEVTFEQRRSNWIGGGLFQWNKGGKLCQSKKTVPVETGKKDCSIFEEPRGSWRGYSLRYKRRVVIGQVRYEKLWSMHRLLDLSHVQGIGFYFKRHQKPLRNFRWGVKYAWRLLWGEMIEGKQEKQGDKWRDLIH